MIVAHSSGQTSVTVAHRSKQILVLDVGVKSKISNLQLFGLIG